MTKSPRQAPVIPIFLALVAALAVTPFVTGWYNTTDDPGAAEIGQESSEQAIGRSENSIGEGDEDTVRTHLFREAHRAAVEFSPGDNIQLTDELQLIKPALNSKAERNVYQLFVAIKEIQIDLSVLEAGRRAAKEAEEQFESLGSTAENLAKKFRSSDYKELKTLAQISRAGGVPMSSPLMPKLAGLMERLERHSLKPRELNGVRWLPYQPTKSHLLAMEEAAINSVGEVMYKYGGSGSND